jgi:leucyl aminopeptidase
VTATLSLELDAGPIERSRADVAVVPLFHAERPLRGSAGRVDWRLCGRLSALIAAGRLEGARGEAVLVPTGGGLRAPLLIALGLGSREGFDARCWGETAREALERSLKLGASVVTLPLWVAEAGDFALLEHAEALIAGAAQALADRDAEVHLRVVVSRPEARRAADALRGARPRGMPRAVVLRRVGPALRPPEAPVSRTGAGPRRPAAS